MKQYGSNQGATRKHSRSNKEAKRNQEESNTEARQKQESIIKMKETRRRKQEGGSKNSEARIIKQ